MKLVVIIVAASVCVNLHYCEAEDKSSRQVSYNNCKPSAHIEASNLAKVTYNANQTIKDWSVSAPNSYLAGGMSYADGKLTVPVTGLYYIYLHAYQNSYGRVLVNVNNAPVALINAPYPPSIQQFASQVGGLFNLKENDEISFTSHWNGCVLYMASKHTFFGAYLVELGI